MIICFYYRERKIKRRKPKNVCECKERERERLDGSSIEDSSLSSRSSLLSPSYHFSFFSLFSVVKKNQKANFSFRKKVEWLKKMG
jgi:hypothetical protein